MMILEVSGGVLSSLIFDQIHSPSDQEGLILGSVRIQTERIISDSHIDHKNERVIYEVEKTVVCPTLRYFYDKKGNILAEKLEELLHSCQSKKVIGWYKSRQNSILSMSLWEKKVHRNLCDYIQSSQPLYSSSHSEEINPIFGLFTTEQSSVLSDRAVNKVFYTYKTNGRRWASLKLKIGNLGNTTSHYKQTTPNCSPSIPGNSSITDKYRKSLIDKDTQSAHTTKLIDNLAEEMCDKLRDLCTQVQSSELEVHNLEEDISLMKQILCATISHSQGTDEDFLDSDPNSITDNDEGVSNSMSKYKQSMTQVSPLSQADNEEDEVYLIDLAENGTENNVVSSGPVVKCTTTSSDSFERIDFLPDNQIISSSKAKGDVFDFVNDLMVDGSCRPKTRFQVAVESTEVSSGASDAGPSPPTSPVY